MVPSIFSRRSAPEPEAPEVSSTLTHPTTLVGSAREKWHSRLNQDIAADSTSLSTLPLFGTHPGGLAQLYMEHPVRLSLFIRKPITLGRTLERARSIIVRLEQRASAYDTGPIHLGIGTVSWRNGTDAVTVPVLLRLARFVRRNDDVLIALGHGGLLAPEPAEALRSHGLDVDGDTILAQASGAHGFSSPRAMAALYDACAALPRFEVHGGPVIGLLCHPAGVLTTSLAEDVTAFEDSQVIRVPAGDRDARSDLRSEAPVPNPADRDPWAERGIGDLIPSQQDVVEAASGGRSVFIDIPAYGDDASVVATILADTAATDRSVPHVLTSPSRSIAAYTRLADLGLADIVVNIDGYSDACRTLATRVSAAIEGASPAVDQASVDEMCARLRQVRGQLASYVAELHQPYGRFGVCAADTLRAPTDLTNGENALTIRVRLDEKTLYEITVDQGESAHTLLCEVLTSGTLKGSASSAWGNAVLISDEQVSDALLRADRLFKTLSELRVRTVTITGEAGTKPAGMLAQWDCQLAMFDGIADLLDVFLPRVFERSAADAVIATAPRQWRKDHDISMGRSERSRLVKQAQDLVRPGVHVPGLHRALIRVQEHRDAWCAVCNDGSWPIPPAKIGEISVLTDAVRDNLDATAPAFAAEEPDLVGTHLQRLTTFIEHRAGDTSAIREVPVRPQMRERLAVHGLDKLAQDLVNREIEDAAIDTKLDLAWWALPLRAMLASQPALGGVDSASLEDLAREGCELNEAQVASLVPQVITGVRRIRTNAPVVRPSQHEGLHDLLADGTASSDLDLLTSYSLVRYLLSILMTAPAMVPVLALVGRTVDVVILDDADGLPLAELVLIIARSHQLIVIGDLIGASENGVTRELTGAPPVARVEPGSRRLNDQVVLLLVRYGYEYVGISVPQTVTNASVFARWMETTGMPAPGAHTIESTAAEMRAAVDAIIEHTAEAPERSFAIVALSERHMQRAREALESAKADELGPASSFDPATPEPFVVAGPDQAAGLTRGSLILSVGFAKTPHGRVAHDFGVLSSEEGVDALAEVPRVVRGDLTFVSTLHSAGIDRDRLGHEGSRMLADLLEIAEGHADEGTDAWLVLAGEPDRLPVDLAERLYLYDLEVVVNVGIPGGMRILLAIGHLESPGRLLLAVLTDDEEYLAEPSQRVCDRARPRWLEARGWVVYTALLMPLLIDPDKEVLLIADALLDALGKLRATDDEPAAKVLERIADDEAADERVEERVEEASSGDGDEGVDKVEDSSDASAPRMPMLDDGLDEESKRHKKADEDTIGMLLAIKRKERASEENRGPRPAIAKGLPLAAYFGNQLDEMAAWVRSDGVERADLEAAEEPREALGITRRGLQSDAVLGNVVRRMKPAASAQESDEASASDDAQLEDSSDEWDDAT